MFIFYFLGHTKRFPAIVKGFSVKFHFKKYLSDIIQFYRHIGIITKMLVELHAQE